ncbi:hypothetical protein [Vulcanisaeta sp. JCM 14467]|uniref:hypothetical protein n=1 Tax=Vulcanisaeta sp. JCM 14467 TaxID=1295370 RepID=UPI002092A159|nr:hypothetical protein [Vulcanisaeta sp. JCM 14467]
MSRVTINLTSPVIHDLAGAIARNDIVGIYANGSDEALSSLYWPTHGHWRQTTGYYSI